MDFSDGAFKKKTFSLQVVFWNTSIGKTNPGKKGNWWCYGVPTKVVALL
jgi:hypothetical protein